MSFPLAYHPHYHHHHHHPSPGTLTTWKRFRSTYTPKTRIKTRLNLNFWDSFHVPLAVPRGVRNFCCSVAKSGSSSLPIRCRGEDGAPSHRPSGLFNCCTWSGWNITSRATASTGFLVLTVLIHNAHMLKSQKMSNRCMFDSVCATCTRWKARFSQIDPWECPWCIKFDIHS